MYWLILIILILLILYIPNDNIELFWLEPTRSTRNMSYDIRGDVPIYPGPVGPWLISPLI
jgi:hypothetical protein